MQYLTVVNSLVISLCLCSLICHILAQQSEVFKINKLNLIWSKAQHTLGQTKLKDLKKDLVRHEDDEIALKKLKAHNEDKDGIFEATVRKKLLSILTKYSLNRYYDDIHPEFEKEHPMKKDNLNKSKIQNADESIEPKATFRDKKLDKLWKKAEQVGFSQDQLMVLHDEFRHQQDKLDEHYEVMNQIEQKLDERTREDVWQNSMEGSLENEARRRFNMKDDKKTSEQKRASLETNVYQGLKDKYKDIKRGIDKLHKKIIDGTPDETGGPFEEEPVNQLWVAANQANFTSEELESLKEELEHYEVRIKKLKHFQYQLERGKISSKDDNLNSEDNEDFKHIKKRVKELTQKVEMTHSSLEKKIIKRRDEL